MRWSMTRLALVALGACAREAVDTGSGDTGGVEAALREQTTFVHQTGCTGCDGLELWGSTYSETDVVGMYPCFHEDDGLLFAEERWDAAIRALDLGACEVLDREVLEPPGMTCLDAGSLVYEAGWEGWSVAPMDYEAMVHGYAAVVAFGDAVEHYVAGVEVTLEAAGGAHVGAFSVRGASPDPLVLRSPVVEGDAVPDIDLGADLEVEWYGGEGDTVRLWVLGEWREPSSYMEVLGCHVSNSGRFTIPGEVLSQLDPGQLAQLSVSDRTLHSLFVPEIEGSAWTLGSWAATFIHYDPGARSRWGEEGGEGGRRGAKGARAKAL